MQQAIGATLAPQPELEPELQQELVRIKPKIEEGTVTKAEADHLHSLEARAHGLTEKGGLTAKAQSVAAKRERALSLSDPSNENQAPIEHPSIASKSQPQTAAISAAEATAQPFAEAKQIAHHTRNSSAVSAH